jgi:hypothetical protein
VSSPPRRKRIRIDHEAYAELGSVASITIACFNRTPFFRDSGVAQAVIGALKQWANATGVKVLLDAGPLPFALLTK